jgi:hypothetical protein
MIGYHYTTREAWEQIQYEGMKLDTIRQHEYDRFVCDIPTLPREAIWVWKEELTDEQAFVVLTSLAIMHDSFDVVLLEIDYEPDSSASISCREHPDDRVRITCNFAIGHVEIDKLPIDLILDDVPARNVTKLWSGNLLAPFQGRHRLRELSVA